MTAVANTAFTAAQFNTHIRDNLLETAPAKATTAGRLFVSTGVNAIAERAISESLVSTAETTTSTSNTNLATVGPAVTITTGTQALIWFGAKIENTTGSQAALMDFAVSGASTRTAADDTCLRHEASANDDVRACTITFITGLTAGSNTFTAKYWVGGGTGTFSNRRLGVMAL